MRRVEEEENSTTEDRSREKKEKKGGKNKHTLLWLVGRWGKRRVDAAGALEQQPGKCRTEREKIVFELEGEGRQSQQQRGSISSREGAVEGGETTREIVRVWQKQDFFFKIKIYKSAIKIQKARALRPLKKPKKRAPWRAFGMSCAYPHLKPNMVRPGLFCAQARFFKLRGRVVLVWWICGYAWRFE